MKKLIYIYIIEIIKGEVVYIEDFYFRLFLNNGKSRFTLTTDTIENGNMRLESIT